MSKNIGESVVARVALLSVEIQLNRADSIAPVHFTASEYSWFRRPLSK